MVQKNLFNLNRHYVLDTCVLIDASHHYYSFDLCPGFWQALDSDRITERICSIDKVYDEIRKFSDETLSSWVVERRHLFEPSCDEDTINTQQSVSRYVDSNKQYSSDGRRVFLSGADSWLIAYAKVHGLTLVTNEVSAPDSKTPKIPDICKHFGVSCILPFPMFRDLRMRFVMAQEPDNA